MQDLSLSLLLGIKAAGGIRDLKTALALVAGGAGRLGCSSSIAIVREAVNYGQRNELEELRKKIEELRKKDKSDPIATFCDKKTPPTLTYAWNWFSYHASQRLTAFHYFLIIVGFLVAGYITCVDKKLYAMQVVLGFVGVLISIAFLALDARNEQLVDDGRDALRKLEQALGMEIGIHTVDCVREKKDAPLEMLLFNKREESLIDQKILISHGVWLRRIERVAVVLFFGALVLGAYNWHYKEPAGVAQPESKIVK